MSDAKLKAKLIVTDTGPLITLAIGEALDYLFYPGIPVYIPDAVLHEATIKNKALGAENILKWVQEHTDDIHMVATQAYADFNTMRDVSPGHRERDLGERAAIETIRYVVKLQPNERAILITEDDWTLRGPYIIAPGDRERVIPITTYDFLLGLEKIGRINSTNEVYRLIESAGRDASRVSMLEEQGEHTREAVAAMLKKSTASTKS
jgi:hypothetical protein